MMSIERLPQKNTDTDRDEQEIFKSPTWIGKYEVIGNNAYDYARKLSFALPLVAAATGLITPERAHAVEIPSDATYEQGIDLLSEAARTDKFETGALFVRFPNGLTRWYSVEGDEDSVSTEGHNGVLNQIIRDGISDNSLKPGDVLTVASIHNHPQFSAEKVGLVNEGTTFASFPPSGDGLASSGGDTGYEVVRGYQERLEKLEHENGVTINSFDQVVDPLGIWTYQLDFDEAGKAGNELLYDIEKRDVNDANLDRMYYELHKIQERIANFTPSPELSALYTDRSDMHAKIQIDKILGNEIGEGTKAELDSINSTISRLESEEGLGELEKARDALSDEIKSMTDVSQESFQTGKEDHGRIRDEMESLRGAWILGVIENGVQDTLDSELYTNLVDGYREVGVRISYKPFSE